MDIGIIIAVIAGLFAVKSLPKQTPSTAPTQAPATTPEESIEAALSGQAQQIVQEGQTAVLNMFQQQATAHQAIVTSVAAVIAAISAGEFDSLMPTAIRQGMTPSDFVLRVINAKYIVPTKTSSTGVPLISPGILSVLLPRWEAAGREVATLAQTQSNEWFAGVLSEQ